MSKPKLTVRSVRKQFLGCSWSSKDQLCANWILETIAAHDLAKMKGKFCKRKLLPDAYLILNLSEEFQFRLCPYDRPYVWSPSVWFASYLAERLLLLGALVYGMYHMLSKFSFPQVRWSTLLWNPRVSRLNPWLGEPLSVLQRSVSRLNPWMGESLSVLKRSVYRLKPWLGEPRQCCKGQFQGLIPEMGEPLSVMKRSVYRLNPWLGETLSVLKRSVSRLNPWMASPVSAAKVSFKVEPLKLDSPCQCWKGKFQGWTPEWGSPVIAEKVSFKVEPLTGEVSVSDSQVSFKVESLNGESRLCCKGQFQG